MRALAIALVAVAALSGCAQGTIPDISRVFERKGEPLLKSGIRNYEDGRLAQASRDFESAISAGLSDADRVTAHKYLAFVHCVSRRQRQCRGHFRSALDIDPGFELQPAEAGHPMWGPVFRSVKASR